MLKLISSLFSYLKKKRKIQVISEVLFSYLNKAKKIQVTPEIIFSYLKKKKKIHILSGVLFLFLIIILFSTKKTSDSHQSDKEIISTELDEKNNYKYHDLSKNTENEIQELKKKQTAKNEFSKSIKPPEKKKKKPLIKNQLEEPQKNKVKQVPKKPEKNDQLRNSSTPTEVVNNLHVGLKKS